MSQNTVFLKFRKYWLESILLILVVATGFIQLEHYPPVWWDEGWTLMVARNWVEQGHYGLYQDGLPRDAGLAGHFPMVAMVALSFKLFGVGVWQGRLPVVLMALATMALLYHFSNRWWGRKVALGTVFVCLFLCLPQVSILMIGRQTLGEVPVLCLLLAGYACIEIGFKSNRLWFVVTAFLWGIGIAIKSQPLPFWLVSVFFYILVSLITRQWRKRIWFLPTAFGALIVYRLLEAIPATLTHPTQGSSNMVEGLMNVTGLVLDIDVRWTAIQVILIFGLPAFMGLTWSGWHFIKELRNPKEIIYPEKWAIWGLCTAWFAWFLFLGMFWPRYFAPAVILASPFISSSLSNFTRGYDLKWLLRQSARLLIGRDKRIGFQALFCLLFITIVLAMNIESNILNFQGAGKLNPEAAAAKLQEIIPNNALVETYESEIIFLAPTLRFHYPPDLVSVKAVGQGTIDPGISLDYDPLLANPDYLLLGDFGRTWKVYDTVLEQSTFKLEASFNGYDLYTRLH